MPAPGVLLLIFILFLQFFLAAERIYNVTLCLVLGVEKSDAAALAAKQTFSQAIAFFIQAFTVLSHVVLIVLDFMLKNIIWLIIVLLAYAVLLTLAQYGLALFSTTLNVYNSGVGMFIDSFLVKPLEIADFLLSPLLAVYNGFTYWLGRIGIEVGVPLVQLNVNILPDMLKNIGLSAGLMVQSTNLLVSRIVECTTPGQNMRCFADANYLTLDLMTPSQYLRETCRLGLSFVSSSCPAARSPIAIVFYPLLDYNLYSLLHFTVNMFLHVITQGISVTKRCEYARSNAALFGVEERIVMCTTDWHGYDKLGTQSSLAFGKLIDNWLDATVALAEREIQLAKGNSPAPLCRESVPVDSAWATASSVMGAFHESDNGLTSLIPLTENVIAFTDGNSTAYYSDFHEPSNNDASSPPLAVALHHWPIKVDPAYGIAVVQTLSSGDEDSRGVKRTGLFGCACVDNEDSISVLCASVPYHYADLAESDAQVQELVFEHENALAGMTCSSANIRVSSLRFARDRFSMPNNNNEMNGLDNFDERASTDSLQGAELTADAIVYITPVCSELSLTPCSISGFNCFPFCMGMRMAAQTAGPVHMFNMQTWRDRVFLMQTDCGTQGGLSNTENLLCNVDENGITVVSMTDNIAGAQLNRDLTRVKSSCQFKVDACVSEEAAMTLRKLQSTDATANDIAVRNIGDLAIQQEAQALVVAGDVMLFKMQKGTKDVLSVFRLRNTQSGIKQEHLSWHANLNTIEIETCSGGETLLAKQLCVEEKVAQGKLVVPSAVSTEGSRIVADSTQSRWSVHWAENTNVALLQAFANKCHNPDNQDFTIALKSLYFYPRVWTVNTMRETTLGRTETSSQNQVHFVSVPDFLTPDSPCHAVHNVEVLSLEYVNDQNLILTTVADTLSNYLSDTRSPPTHDNLRHYYVHPNLHECADVIDALPGLTHTCMRPVEQGMFPAPEDPTALPETVLGTLCVAADRAPKFGSAAAYVGAAVIKTIKMVLEVVFVVPALLVNGVGVDFIFNDRQVFTYTSLLDSSGNTFLNVDSIFLSLDTAAFHTWHSLERLGNMFRDEPGGNVAQSVLIGTSRILQHSKYGNLLSDALLAKLANLFRTPSTKMLKSFQENVVTSPFGKLPKSVLTIQRYAMSVINTVRMNARVLRNWAVRVFQQIRIVKTKPPKRSTPAAATSSKQIIAKTVMDLKENVNMYIILPARAQCTGLGLIFGGSSPLAHFAEASCQTVFDGLDGVMHTLVYIFSAYPAIQCACSLGPGAELDLATRVVCAEKINSFQSHMWTEILLQSQSKHMSVCHSTMDTVNGNLEHAFDRMFARLETVADTFGRSLDYLTIFFDVNAGSCAKDVTNPYVVTLMPQPMDYFVMCKSTDSCRSKCLDSYTAFERAYAAAELAGSDLTVSIEQNVDIRSQYFSLKDIENNLHLPPFEIHTIAEYPAAVCSQLCTTSQENRAEVPRCAVVAGVNNTDAVPSIAYYCMPRDIAHFTRQQKPLPSLSLVDADVEDVDSLPLQGVLVDMHILTLNRIEQHQHETLLVLEDVAESSDEAVQVLSIYASHWDGTRLARRRVELVRTTFEQLPENYNFDNLLVKLWVRRLLQIRVIPSAHGEYASLYMFAQQHEWEYGAHQRIVEKCFHMHLPSDFFSPEYVFELGTHPVMPCDSQMAFPSDYSIVCLHDNTNDNTNLCGQELWIPLKGHKPIQKHIMSHSLITSGEIPKIPVSLGATVYQATPGKSLTKRLALKSRQPLYMSQNGYSLANQPQLATVSFQHSAAHVDVLMFKPSASAVTWLHNAHLTHRQEATGNGLWQASVASSEVVERRVALDVQCSLNNCGACKGLDELHTLCVVAQDCAVRKCIGTTVNLRRPLCNIGKSYAVVVRIFREALVTAWAALSHFVIISLEISQQRREQYEVLWPEEAITSMMCLVKDNTHDFSAIVMSTVGGNLLTAAGRRAGRKRRKY